MVALFCRLKKDTIPYCQNVNNFVQRLLFPQFFLLDVNEQSMFS